MAIKFNPLVLEGFDLKGASLGLGIGISGSSGNSILTTDSGGLLTEKVLNNGQLLIGKTGDEPQVASLTGTTNRIIVTNGPGSITLSTPQDLHTTASVVFGSLQVPTITTSLGNLSLNPVANIDVNSKRIINVANPISLNDAANKIYVDNAINGVYANPDFEDSVFRISDDVDTTKKIAFQASAISSGSTRTISMPDQNINLGLLPTAIQRDGSVVFTSNQSMGVNRLTNLANPINPLDAANKAYVDSVIAGLDFQKDVDDVVNNPDTVGPGAGLPAAATGQRYILTANTSSLHSSWGTISGVQDNDIVEYDGSQWNVVYDVSAQGEGALAWNKQGTYWVRWDGTSWDEFGGLSGVTAGAGLDKTGHTIFIELDSNAGLEFDTPGDGGKLRARVDGSTIERHSSGLRVKAGGITSIELAANSVTTTAIVPAAVTEPKLALNSVSTSKIVNNAVTGSKIRLNNDEWLRGRNAADSADVNIIRVNSSDDLEIGQNLLPSTHATFNIGNISSVFNNIYVRSIESDTSTLSLNAGTNIDVNSKKITSLASPTAASDAVNKDYVDTALGDYLKRNGSNNITGSINLNAADTYTFASVAYPFLEIFSNRFSVVESSAVRARLQSFTSPSSVTVYGIQTQNVPAALATNSPPMGDSNHVYVETGNVTGTSNSGNIYLRTGTVTSGTRGIIDVGNTRITNLANPINAQDAATKNYAVARSGGDTVSGTLTFTGGAKITGLPNPTTGSDAATKEYVDNIAPYSDVITVTSDSITVDLIEDIVNIYAVVIHIYVSFYNGSTYRNALVDCHIMYDENTSDFILTTSRMGDSFPEITFQMNNTPDDRLQAVVGSMPGLVSLTFRLKTSLIIND